MAFSLVRSTGGELSLTDEHEALVLPRRGSIDWESFRRADYDTATLDAAGDAWRVRALQEYHSLALFTQLSSQLHLLGAPLDWSGAFARMIVDEVRHTDVCMKMCAALGREASPSIIESDLHLVSDRTLREQVRDVVLAAFCIGETISGRMFKGALRAATVPLARDVVSAILIDETFHGELGWELGALLMRGIEDSERAYVVSRVPFLFDHYAGLCGAKRGRAWAESEPKTQTAPNFGTLTSAGYAAAQFEGMEEDVVPGFEAIGIPEARGAWEILRAKLV
ncbi:hypothetical protein BH09MYX1_BH09MYX1_63040 [soil metagenome]